MEHRRGSRFTLAAASIVVSLVGMAVAGLPRATTVLLSADSTGTKSGNGASFHAIVSADGGSVAFDSDATDLVGGVVLAPGNVFVTDLATGRTALVSANLTGAGGGNGASFAPASSAHGRFVAFTSGATDLVPESDDNAAADAFVRDLKRRTTMLLSVDRSGTAAGDGESYSPVLDADGRMAAFVSTAGNLVEQERNGPENVFVRDLSAGRTILASVNLAGTGGGDGSSTTPAISADGRFVAFESDARDLTPHGGPIERAINVFVRDLRTGFRTPSSATTATPAPSSPSSSRRRAAGCGCRVTWSSVRTGTST